ncbi:MAG: hypothetical protein JWO78_1162 [Micavibrio sp.]|nr:hypothetical protein [Micavibrio sp.]
MTDFNTTLLREKFVIRDAFVDNKPRRQQETAPVIALSNRIVLPLVSKDGVFSETIIVRAQNMHSCARMAARIVGEFQDVGPLLTRLHPFDWKYAWLSITKGYETKYNPNRWVAVYHKGRVIFEDGETQRHPFLDIIEQCDARNPDDYEKAVNVAEDAFRQAGKIVTIQHDSNVAFVLNYSPAEARGGVIVRGPNRTMTFNFTAKAKAGRPVKISQCLSVAAAFLEGIQMAFQVGMIKQKQSYDMIDAGSDEGNKGREAAEKLGRLNGAIQQFENLLDVTYRPERPDFGHMIDEAQAFAKQSLAAELQRRMDAGESDKADWVS